MTTPAGWYGEPGNAELERYWDGTQWTPQTRAVELPPAPEPVAPAAGLSAATCAIPTCVSQREPGSDYCTKHGPRRESKPRRTTPTPRGDAQIVCPHCQVRGKVKSREVKVKRGVSGGKATAAVFTAGISMLGTGLSRKEKHIEMSCGNCKTTWLV